MYVVVGSVVNLRRKEKLTMNLLKVIHLYYQYIPLYLNN